MNNYMLTHIGGEIIIIAGVVYYCQRKNTLLKEELDKTNEKVKKLFSIITELQEDIQQMGAVMMHLQKNSKSSRNLYQDNIKSNIVLSPIKERNPPLSKRKLQTKVDIVQQPKQESIEFLNDIIDDVDVDVDVETDDELNDDELDKVLSDEFEQLKEERKKNMKCDNDVCELLS